MILAHKIKLLPNKRQITQLNKACGVARYTYNWGLNKWKELYEQGERPNALELKKIWNQEKPDWVYESPKDANQQPFSNLGTAFTRFFKKLAKYPRFKKKNQNDSFYVSNDKFKLKDNKVRLPLIGWIKLTEELRFNGKIISATITKKANQYFIAIQVEVKNYNKKRKSNKQVGVDTGITNALTLNDGKQYFAPKPFKNQKDRITKLQRRLARKKEGSNNRNKAKINLQRAYLRLTNIRNDFWHKMTSMLCNENQIICIEDLNVKGMIKNRKLSFTLADVGLGEFYRQLEYKKLLWNNIVQKIDQWFPSTKLCSNCHCTQKMDLSERVYNCPHCGIIMDRDLNAAKNILAEGLRTAGLAGINVCGHVAST